MKNEKEDEDEDKDEEKDVETYRRRKRRGWRSHTFRKGIVNGVCFWNPHPRSGEGTPPIAEKRIPPVEAMMRVGGFSGGASRLEGAGMNTGVKES